MTVKQQARASAIRAIRWHKKHSPTLFDPHYEIKGASVSDPLLSSRLGNTKKSRGPQFKTLQWEGTGKRPDLTEKLVRALLILQSQD